MSQVVCLIDRSASKPAGETAASSSKEEPKLKLLNLKLQKLHQHQLLMQPVPFTSCQKILDEKGIEPATVSGTGRDGRITKRCTKCNSGFSCNGVSNTGSRAQTTTKLSVLRRKLAARLVSVKMKPLCLLLLTK